MSNIANNKTILEYALEYHEHRLCVIPIPYGKKITYIKWKKYQTERPDEKQLQDWFKNNNKNIAVVLGEVSNSLACRDFDTIEGYEEWAAFNSDLAEILPTVKTARGYQVYFKANITGRTDIIDAEGKHHGELRGSRHYCMLPPSLHPKGLKYQWVNPLDNGNLLSLEPVSAGFIADSKDNVDVTERTERIERKERKERKDEIIRDIDINSKIQKALLRTQPEAYGTRHRKIFEFARELYSMPEYTDAEPDQFKTIVKQWHSVALPNITTKEFEETWIDFLKAWPKIRYKIGDEPITQIFRKAAESEYPKIAVEKYPDNLRLQILVSLCRELQKEAGNAPFFLATRTGGKLFNVEPMTISRWLFLLEKDKIIRTVDKGGTSKNPRKASRFIYIA